MLYVHTALAWIAAHPAECWLIVSATLNILLRVHTPEWWVSWCSRYPVVAAAVRVVRALGVDPATALRAVAALAAARAAGATLGGLLGTAPATAAGTDDAPPTPRDPSVSPPTDGTGGTL